MERIQNSDDPDLIKVLYGDFVRKVFQGYRVTVTPGRPWPGATPTPQLSVLEQGDGKYGKANLFDDLVVISGAPGSLREEHLGWLERLRRATQARLEELESTLAIDPLTGLSSERSFHTVLRTLPRKGGWVGWLLCATIVPGSQATPTVESVEKICCQIADFLRQQQPADTKLFRMDNGFFVGLVPKVTKDRLPKLAEELHAGLASLKLDQGTTVNGYLGVLPWPSRSSSSLDFYQRLTGTLKGASSKPLTLADLRRIRPR